MSSTKLALILAAGNGSPIAVRSGGLPKPLVQLNGRPLLEHVLRGAQDAGIERFVIVVGYRGEAIKEWSEKLSFNDLQVTWIENSEHRRDNGISVLRAKHVIHEPFLLLMADHMFDPVTARSLLRQPVGKDEVILAVDRNIGRVFDLDDATKVRLDQDRILDIGKHLEHYDALDTGMFLCSESLFRWLEEAKVNENCSLSDGLRLMTKHGTFRAFDIGEAMWQDVDTPEALDFAQQTFAVQRRGISGIVRPLYA